MANSFNRDVTAELAVIDGLHDVPGADVVTNAQLRDVIGNKTDAIVEAVAATKSIIAYQKDKHNFLIS